MEAGGGLNKAVQAVSDPYASAGAAAASGRAQPLYPAGAELPPAASSVPPPPFQGHPGVPAARGQASVDPSAEPPPRPCQELPARGACGPLATNHLRGLRGLAPGSLHSPGFTAREGLGGPGSGQGRPAQGPGGAAGRGAQSPAASVGGKCFAPATWPCWGEGGLRSVTVQSCGLGLGVGGSFCFVCVFFNENHF